MFNDKLTIKMSLFSSFLVGVVIIQCGHLHLLPWATFLTHKMSFLVPHELTQRDADTPGRPDAPPPPPLFPKKQAGRPLFPVANPRQPCASGSQLLGPRSVNFRIVFFLLLDHVSLSVKSLQYCYVIILLIKIINLMRQTSE